MHFGTFVPFHRKPASHSPFRFNSYDWLSSVCMRDRSFSVCVWLKCSRRILVTIGSFQFTMIRRDSKWSMRALHTHDPLKNVCKCSWCWKLCASFFPIRFVCCNKCSIEMTASSCIASLPRFTWCAHIHTIFVKLNRNDGKREKNMKRQQLVLLFNDLRSVQMRSRSHF